MIKSIVSILTLRYDRSCKVAWKTLNLGHSVLSASENGLSKDDVQDRLSDECPSCPRTITLDTTEHAFICAILQNLRDVPSYSRKRASDDKALRPAQHCSRSAPNFPYRTSLLHLYSTCPRIVPNA